MSSMDEVAEYLSGKQIHGALLLSPEVSSSLSDMLVCERKRASKIEALQSKIAALLDEHKRVIANLQNVLSPIRRLPPEILSEIFLRYIWIRRIGDSWPVEKNEANLFYRDLPPIVLLSQVCSFWRQTITFTPCLWSLIQLTVRKHYDYPNTQLFGEWLGRGVNCPLDIVVTIPSILGRFGDSAFPLDALINVCSRWRTFELDMGFQGMAPLLQKEPLDLPLLEKVSLSTSVVLPHSNRLSVFANASRVTSFTFNAEIPPRTDVVLIDFPSSPITELNLGNVSGSDPSLICRFIKDCPLLESLSVKLDDITDGCIARIIQDIGVIHLARLRVLRVEFTGEYGSPEFLDAFRLPALKELVLSHPYDLDELMFNWDEEMWDGDDDDYFGPFTELFERVSPRTCLLNLQKRSQFELRSLNLYGITTIDAFGLVDFLRVVPSLESLDLEGCYLNVGDLCKDLMVRKPKGKKGKKVNSNNMDHLLVPNLTKIRLVQGNEWDYWKRDYLDDDFYDDDSIDATQKYKYTISRVVELRWHPSAFYAKYYQGPSTRSKSKQKKWLDSWPVSRLTGGLEVSKPILMRCDIFADFSDDRHSCEKQMKRLRKFEGQGMPLRIV
ncbi:hypothetical protein VKT23_007987 [Stygiomarasmius scandens]|uniref:F-box domain-containing protein n=1 Tax=Marasmiellus scandens TaxID=2682957 RepID=A0ABR1JLQ4_9AGAR